MASPESQTIQEHFPTLISAIASPDTVADHLFAKSIITSAVHENVTSGANRLEKNRKLMSALLSHMVVTPQSFQVFLAILKKQQVYEDLIKILQSTYASKCKPDQQCTSGQPCQPKVVHAELKDLLTKLEDVIDWQQFGVHIGVSSASIQTIAADYRGVRDCKLHLFLEWTKKEEPTWNKVIQALFDIKMEHLAKTLAAQYGLPVPPASA